jgi:hypothetical protein
MKRSKFTDEQILKIVREGEAGRKVADLCRTHGITGKLRKLLRKSGGPPGDRTRDTLIKSQVLYH